MTTFHPAAHQSDRMSDPHPITFDTGNPLEGYRARLPRKHGRGRGAGALTNPDDYRAAEGGGLESHDPLARTQSTHEMHVATDIARG